jgi:hypothetical protein
VICPISPIPSYPHPSDAGRKAGVFAFTRRNGHRKVLLRDARMQIAEGEALDLGVEAPSSVG